jgi:hypothetical protein
MFAHIAAPSTRLVAVNCACCRTPLADAPSVEQGIGPVCAKRHGFKRPDGDPNWELVRVAVAAAMDERPELDLSEALRSDDARRVANLLVHRIAVFQTGAGIGRMVQALFATGFQTLAARVAERVGAIRVAAEGEELVLKAKYSPELTDALRRIPGRRWDSANKVNRCPATQRVALWSALKTVYPQGTFVIGTKGIATL